MCGVCFVGWSAPCTCDSQQQGSFKIPVIMSILHPVPCSMFSLYTSEKELVQNERQKKGALIPEQKKTLPFPGSGKKIIVEKKKKKSRNCASTRIIEVFTLPWAIVFKTRDGPNKTHTRHCTLILNKHGYRLYTNILYKRLCSHMNSSLQQCSPWSQDRLR